MDIKYIGMDVHKEAIAIAVMNGDGKLVMESIIETKASTILDNFPAKWAATFISSRSSSGRTRTRASTRSRQW